MTSSGSEARGREIRSQAAPRPVRKRTWLALAAVIIGIGGPVHLSGCVAGEKETWVCYEDGSCISNKARIYDPETGNIRQVQL